MDGGGFGYARRRLANLPSWGWSQFARQRLANLVGMIREVEQAHVLDVLTGEAAPKPLRQVRSQPFNERSPVVGPFLPRLLELDDAMPNQPIGGGHGGVHRTGGRVSGRVDDLRHVSKDGLVGGVVLAECPVARGERRRRVLGAPAQADVDWKRFQVHQTSASMWSPARSASGGESVAGAACLSLAACSSSRVKRRRSRSSASGAGLGEDPDHPELGSVLYGPPPAVLFAFALHISLSRRSGRRAHLSPALTPTALSEAYRLLVAGGAGCLPSSLRNRGAKYHGR